MTDKTELSKKQGTTTNQADRSDTLLKKHLPTLVGGGTFALLILITLLMYFANA